MSPATPRRSFTWIGAVLLQVLIWATLTFAFAALLRLAGPQSWSNALYFAGLNWLPWAVLAPAVFWLSGRFPIERGHFWRSIPAHVVGCVACVSLTLWVSTSFTFPSRQGPRPEEPPPMALSERLRREEDPSKSPATPPPPPRSERERERFERFGRGAGREPFGRRGPFWWPFLGATLLRANFDAAVYFIIVVAAHAMAFYRRAQDRERHAIALAASLHEAKLDALRLQLQPHFLFNALNAISTLVHRDANAADNLIGDLSDLLRLSLQTAEHQVPLARELELLDRYLAIEQTRLGDRLKVVRELDPELLDALVPTFLLQPLVENAIRHGIEPRMAAGTVTIKAHRQGEMMVLSVGDDGVGFVQPQKKRERQGIGISNTEARLRTLHGDRARLEMMAGRSGGVEVRITLPHVRRATGKGLGPGDVPAAEKANSGTQPSTTAQRSDDDGSLQLIL